MTHFIKTDPWNIIEEGHHPDANEAVESCFTLGNGRMGHRGFFEEHYSGHSFVGNYLAGVYFQRLLPEAHVKKGLPGQVTKILNAPNWVGIDIHIDGEMLDLNTAKIKDFQRVLNMREGYLERSFSAKLLSGKEIKVKATRFCSLDKKELGVVRYAVKAVNFDGAVTFTAYLDGDVANRSDNWDGPYWSETDNQVKNRSCFLSTESKMTAFRVCTGMKIAVYKNKQEVKIQTTQQQEDKYAACTVDLRCKQNDEVILYKYAAVVSTLHHDKGKLLDRCQSLVRKAYKKGFDKLLKKQASAWAAIWDRADVALEGDPAAQQALRFGIFQLYQSFDGQQAKSSLLPGGFSGERKQGNIQWDTELMALPFFLATADHPTAKNLLLYRCQQLPLAIQHAEKQGYGKGAALFPASTQNGYESHPDWEIALGGIHRNAAVVFAIQDYLEWTDDMDFLLGQGLPVLVAVARFWAQRVHWSEPKKAYVLLGTVGPNEYEANVNNNWYTNYMAAWCLQKTLESLQRAAGHDPEKYAATLKALQFDPEKECKHWKEIAAKLYLPLDKTTGVFLQQEAYLDKVQETAAVVPPSERPLRKYWPWDQLLRSCFVQQPDTLLGLYLLPNHFTEAELKCNFDFYAPKTLHENSFSACLHAVLACRLGQYGLAWDYFTAAQSYGLAAPVASMAEGLHTLHGIGNWLALLKGFGGLSTDRGQLAFAPSLPPGCTAFSFKIQWRGQLLEVKANVQGTTLVNHSDQVLDLVLYGEKCSLAGKQEKTFQLQS